MAIDRNRLEQDALRLLQRGQNERALEQYLILLRDQPRDLRVRQQVADLYLKVGESRKAEQHLREIAKFLKNNGKARAAIGVFKQILRIKPEDTAVLGDLGECYHRAGFPKEALEAFERVVEAHSKYNPDKAVPYQKRIIALKPGVLPVQVKLAELYEASNWSERAQQEWRRLAREARRHGSLDDRARFLMRSIAARKSIEITLEAAEAWIDVGDFQEALPLLQTVTATTPEDPRALSLLARTLIGLEAKDKAQQVWLVVARLHLAAGDATARAAALRAAIEAGATDTSLEADLAQADLTATRLSLRLTDCEWAEPADDAAGDLVVRASVFSQYGFTERAREVLESANDDIKQVMAVQVALLEARAAGGDTDGALALLRSLPDVGAEAQQDIRVRRFVLEGRVDDLDEAETDESGLLDDDELLDDDLLDDEMLDDEPTDPGQGDVDDDELLDDDELIDDDDDGDGDSGEPAPAPAVESAGLGELFGEPAQSQGGDDLASLFGPLDGGAPTAAAGDGLDALFGDSLQPVAPAAPHVPSSGSASVAGSSAFADAEALLRVGSLERALALLSGDSLVVGILRARVLRAQGELPAALSAIRDAVDVASESDAAYRPALLEMAEITAATGKLRGARRLLAELEDIDPNYEPETVALVRRGLELLQG